MQKIIPIIFKKRSNLLFIFLFCLYQLCFIQTYAQTKLIQGKVTSSKLPIVNASVSFIDNSDTTRKFTALTDASGNYQINLDLTSIESKKNLPAAFELEQNYPNPFSSTTSISYGLKKESDVNVSIYDILGRVVKKFSVGQQSTGLHNFLWDGKNNFGQKVASGVYFYKLSVGAESQVKKMIFNQGSGSTSLIQHFSSLSKNSSLQKAGSLQDVYGNIFTIRVENTSTTTPVIISAELQNVTIDKDTTIDFTVEYLPTVDINFDSLRQIIRGYGAANIVGWRPDMSDSEIETAFGTGEGQLGFTILRLRIPPDNNQWSINVPAAKKVYDMGVKIIASPWSPPASMKTNNNLVGGELKEDAYVDYAAHLNSFVDYMSSNGIPIYAVSVQNEPDITVSYESCDWSPSQMLKFVKENATSIGTRVMAPESFQFRHNMSDPILNDSAASANLDIAAGHIYGGGLASYPLAEEKGKEIWMTEHLTESAHSANVWSLALDVGVEMQRVMTANMSAYVWWYIVRYYGPIGDGESSTSFPNENFAEKGEVTKKGYVMSQFARFIRPGYYRTESSVAFTAGDVSVTAYKDSSSSKLIIVAVNSSSALTETVFRIQNESLNTNFTPYITSEFKNCEKGEEFNVSGSNFTYTLEPSSITTFVSK